MAMGEGFPAPLRRVRLRWLPLAWIPFPLLALPAVAAFAVEAGAQQAQVSRGQPDSLQVVGQVRDRATGHGVVAALVVFETVGPDPRPGWRGASGELGFFAPPPLVPGRYRLRVQAIGFELLEEEVLLEGAADVRLSVELVPEALQMEPLVVQTLRPTRLERSGFYDRRARGIGRTLTRSEIEAMNPSYPSDIFQRMAGVRVAYAGFGRGSTLLMRGGCPPTILIDGLSPPAGLTIDELLVTQDIEAVEVYSGATTPAQLGVMPTRCGTVVVWTREGGRGGAPMTWGRAIMGGVFVALLFFLSG